MPTLYYLNWDRESRDEETGELGPASKLFHKYNVESVLDEDEKPPEQFSQDRFNELYREVAEVEPEQPETVWRMWNRGSGYESEQFLNEEERSMSVGDVVEINGTYHLAAPVGFKEIEVIE